MTITVIGSLNADVVAYTKVVPAEGETVKGTTLEHHLGGKGFNEAVAVARLRGPHEKNVRVAMWGKVGSDPVGAEFLDALHREGVETDNVAKVHGPSGTAIITVVPNGGNRILVIPGANGELKPNAAELDEYFNKSAIRATLSSTSLASSVHSHATHPSEGSPVRTVDISGHEPSGLNAHGSSAALQRAVESRSGSDVGLVKRGGSFVHHPSINADYNNDSTGSLKPPPNGFRIPVDINREPTPTGMSSHTSFQALDSLNPAPSVESFPGISRDASASVSARNSYLSLAAHNYAAEVYGAANNGVTAQETPGDFVIIQNEFPNSTQVIHHLAKKNRVSIVYNPSPLVAFDEDLLQALHESDVVVVNEVEARDIVAHFHPNPQRAPLTLLRNTSNFVPQEDIAPEVDVHVGILTKLRTLLTKPSIVVTLGGLGAIHSPAGQFSYGYVPSMDLDEEEVVDTTGCGDTFLGALTLQLHGGNALDAGVKFATQAAGLAATARGASDSIPKWGQVEKRGWIL